MSYFHVEDGVIVKFYPRGLPKNWRNISGLNKATPSHLKSLGFMPQRKVGETAEYNSSTHRQSGPLHVVGTDEVVSTWSLHVLTAEELTARAAAATQQQEEQDKAEVSKVYTDINTTVGKILFKMANRILVLEGKPEVTADRFRQYADSLKKEAMPVEPTPEEPV